MDGKPSLVEFAKTFVAPEAAPYHLAIIESMELPKNRAMLIPSPPSNSGFRFAGLEERAEILGKHAVVLIIDDPVNDD